MAVNTITVSGTHTKRDWTVTFTREEKKWSVEVWVYDVGTKLFELDSDSRPGPTVAERLVKHFVGKGELHQGERVKRVSKSLKLFKEN